MYQSVLVPVDLSHTERIMPMLNQADALCKTGGKISIVHVVQAIPSYVAAELPGDFNKNSVRDAKEELAEFTRESGIEADIIVRTGSAPANTCLEVASEINADLIVIASHDPGFADYFLGSTAARVVRHAHCSVMVIR